MADRPLIDGGGSAMTDPGHWRIIDKKILKMFSMMHLSG